MRQSTKETLNGPLDCCAINHSLTYWLTDVEAVTLPVVFSRRTPLLSIAVSAQVETGHLWAMFTAETTLPYLDNLATRE